MARLTAQERPPIVRRVHSGPESMPARNAQVRDPRDERTGRILLALAYAVALLGALADFTAPWDGGFKGAMTALYEDVFVRNHLEHGLAKTHWSPAFFVDGATGEGNWHWHHPPWYPLWLTLFAKLLGHTEPVLRIAHLLLFLPGIAGLWSLLRTVANARIAGWAALLFAATPLVGYFGPMVCYDGALMAFCVLTVASFEKWSRTATRAGWWRPAAWFFATASIDFLGQFCGLALFVFAWFTPHPRRAALGVIAMFPLAVISIAATAVLYGSFLGGPMGFVREMLHFSGYEQSRAGEITAEAVTRAFRDVLVVFGTWPVLALAGLGLAAARAERDLRDRRFVGAVLALFATPVLGSLVTLKHFVDHPFWPMPLMAGAAALAAIGPAIGQRLLRDEDFVRQLAGATLLLFGVGATVHGALVTQERIAFFARNDDLFPQLLADCGDRLEGAVAGFTNRTVISRRYEPGLIFQGEVDEAWEVDFVLAYGKQSGFRGDAVFVLDPTVLRPEFRARLDQLAKGETHGKALLYRFRAW